MTVAAHQERLMTVIRGPHISEKTHLAAESNQVVFKVRTDATKSEIRQAVELLFEVKVDDVMKKIIAQQLPQPRRTEGRRRVYHHTVLIGLIIVQYRSAHLH